MNQVAYRDESVVARREVLNGTVVMMSPRPAVLHTHVSGNIYCLFRTYLKGKKCKAFPDGIEVWLDEKNQVVPDGMVVCDWGQIKEKHIQGAPDLVVEVLSLSTAKNDRGYKKSLYEKHGVKEYWIVDPANRAIEVYLLKGGVFDLDNIYMMYPDYEIEDMKKDQIAAVTEFAPGLFADMVVKIADVFEV